MSIVININDISEKVKQAIANDLETGVIKLKGFEGAAPACPDEDDALIYQRTFISGGYKVTQLVTQDENCEETIVRSFRTPL